MLTGNNSYPSYFSAISSVLKRRLVILGGLSGLNRTIQEPDHAFKEAVRTWIEEDPKEDQSGAGDQADWKINRQLDLAETSNSKHEVIQKETEEDLDSLYLGHLAESHYVSLRRQDWEERLHHSK